MRVQNIPPDPNPLLMVDIKSFLCMEENEVNKQSLHVCCCGMAIILKYISSIQIVRYLVTLSGMRVIRPKYPSFSPSTLATTLRDIWRTLV